jgi:hypothetical protein
VALPFVGEMGGVAGVVGLSEIVVFATIPEKLPSVGLSIISFTMGIQNFGGFKLNYRLVAQNIFCKSNAIFSTKSKRNNAVF